MARPPPKSDADTVERIMTTVQHKQNLRRGHSRFGSVMAGLAVAVSCQLLAACGGGVPITIRIDEFSMPINIDDTMAQVTDGLKGQGFFSETLPQLPEKWPDELP